MGQIKIYGLATTLNPIKSKMSTVIHSCVVEAFKYPEDKKFHRFFPMNKDDFYYPEKRTEKYTILEISMFEGKSATAKKEFIRLIFARFKNQLGINENDLEITIFETPKVNWGIRGLPGDELVLDYVVNI
jgi:hypothetical protein